MINNDWWDSHCLRDNDLAKLRTLHEKTLKIQGNSNADEMKSLLSQATDLVSKIEAEHPSQEDLAEACELLNKITKLANI